MSARERERAWSQKLQALGSPRVDAFDGIVVARFPTSAQFLEMASGWTTFGSINAFETAAGSSS
jgi:hypothetical protein